MKIKTFFIISAVSMLGCHMYIPPDVPASTTAEKYLDSLYQPDSVEIKTTTVTMGYITLKDYAIPVKRTTFQRDSDLNKVSTIAWADFTRKTNDIVSKEKDLSKGAIVVLNYNLHHTEHTMAFFIDSSFRKVRDTIQMK